MTTFYARRTCGSSLPMQASPACGSEGLRACSANPGISSMSGPSSFSVRKGRGDGITIVAQSREGPSTPITQAPKRLCASRWRRRIGWNRQSIRTRSSRASGPRSRSDISRPEARSSLQGPEPSDPAMDLGPFLNEWQVHKAGAHQSFSLQAGQSFCDGPPGQRPFKLPDQLVEVSPAGPGKIGKQHLLGLCQAFGLFIPFQGLGYRQAPGNRVKVSSVAGFTGRADRKSY